MKPHPLAVFESLDRRDAVLPTFRPLVARGYAIELQRTPAAAIRLPPRAWYVVSLILSDGWYAVAAGGPVVARKYSAGMIRIVGPGGPGQVAWPHGLDAVHLHLDPAALVAVAGAPLSLPPTAVRDGPLADGMRQLVVAAVEDRAATARSDALVTELVARIVTRYAETAPAAPVQFLGRRPYADVAAEIRGSGDENLSIGTLADRAGLTRAHFTRVFTRFNGMPPHHYHLRTRIERAKHLLGTGGFSAAGAAQQSGFADQSHLTRLLVRYAGASPGQYQRLAQLEYARW